MARNRATYLRSRHVSAVLLAGAMTFIGGIATASGDESSRSSADDHAIEILRVKIRSERLYASWATEECLSFYLEHSDAEKVDVAIHEVHTKECGGDPLTQPVVDRFRIHRDPEMIEWFDYVDAEYGDFSKVHTVGHR